MMRLIDADRLTKSFETEIGEHLCEFGGWCTAFQDAQRIIDKAPTIDPEVLRPQWIPVAERFPENASHTEAHYTMCMVMTKYGVTEGWYNQDRESWFILFWYIKPRFQERDIDFVRGYIPRLVKIPLHNGIITAWMPLPEPYDPEDIEKEGKA